jgi:hypothetical protein
MQIQLHALIILNVETEKGVTKEIQVVSSTASFGPVQEEPFEKLNSILTASFNAAAVVTACTTGRHQAVEEG